MSLTTASTSTASRAGSRPSARPNLRIVRDEPGRPAPLRRPTPGYRSELSVRSAPAGAALAAPARPEGRIRLTRRGRFVVAVGTVLLVLLGLVSGVLLLDRTAQAGSTVQTVPVTYRVVLPGETLWQIAGEVAPGADRRDTVARILELNALPSAGVAAGQRIAVPATSR